MPHQWQQYGACNGAPPGQLAQVGVGELCATGQSQGRLQAQARLVGALTDLLPDPPSSGQ